MSVLSHCFSIIIDWCINAPGHGKEVAGGLNDIYKRFIYQLMSNVQITGLKIFDSQILMYSCTHKNDVSLAKQYQNNLSKEHWKHGDLDQEK